MADSTSSILNGLSGLAGGAASTSSTDAAAAQKKKNSEISSNDFMNLLVAQLKNQDPLNPMDNQQFAVQLAQFSQLEQLVSINQKIGGDTAGGGDLSSLASYLGHQVVTNSSTVNVTNHNGGSVVFNLPEAAAAAQVQLVDKSGQVVEAKDLGALAAGEQSVDLSGLNTESGSYTVQIAASTASSGIVSPQAFAAGIVSGVIPGADPKLIVNGSEIGTGDIKEVRLGN